MVFSGKARFFCKEECLFVREYLLELYSKSQSLTTKGIRFLSRTKDRCEAILHFSSSYCLGQSGKIYSDVTAEAIKRQEVFFYYLPFLRLKQNFLLSSLPSSSSQSELEKLLSYFNIRQRTNSVSRCA